VEIAVETFDSLPVLLQTFWLIALPSSVIFLLQTVMTFIGAASSDAVDIPNIHADTSLQTSYHSTFSDSPFQAFSLRNLINFLLGFSWTGVSFYSIIENKTLLVLLSVSVGVSFVYGFFAVIKQIQKLAEDNSFKIEATRFKTAEVYLTIPERRTGKGKILISINGASHELSAMTDYEKIPSGAIVKVMDIENENVVIVEPA
jgi:hypothetical protein